MTYTNKYKEKGNGCVLKCFNRAFVHCCLPQLRGMLLCGDSSVYACFSLCVAKGILLGCETIPFAR